MQGIFHNDIIRAGRKISTAKEEIGFCNFGDCPYASDDPGDKYTTQ